MKGFVLDMGGRRKRFSVDRLKPAYLVQGRGVTCPGP